MNTDKIQTLVQLWDLCGTVCQEAERLADGPGGGEAASDARAGLDDLVAQLQRAAPVPEELLRLREAFGRQLSGGADADLLRDSAATLRALVAGLLTQALLAELRGPAYIDRPTAEALLQYCGRVPHDNSGVYQLLFTTCAKASLSAPRESFEQTLAMLSEQPGLLSGEDKPHPDYVYRPSRQVTFDSCPICGGAGVPYYRALAYQMAGFAHPHLPVKLWMRCGDCGNLYTWAHPEELLPGPGQLIEPDKSRYLTTATATDGSVLAAWEEILRRIAAFAEGRSLLSVGVGRGELPAVALELGYAVDAVETAPDAARHAANMLNISVWSGDFTRYDPQKTYSVILMADVLERMTNPEAALRRAHRMLRDTGALWVSTPNLESAFSRMLKYGDPMWCASGHITYFSYEGFRRLAKQCGFTVRDYRISARYNGSMELILTKTE